MRQVRLASIVAAALATASSLTMDGAGSAANAQGGIVLADSFTPASGFALGTDDAQILTRAGCLEGLARIDFDGRLVPALAKSWAQTAPTVWTVSLRDGVKFHDGRPLNAEAVSGALNNLLKSTPPARAFSPRLIKSVEVVDVATVRITTADPGVLLPYRLASPNAGILSPAAYEGGKINPVGTGTGPFLLREVVPQQALILQRNPDYWGGVVAAAEAEVRFIPDGGVRATQVRSGESHIARNVPVAGIKSLAAMRGIETRSIETPRTAGLYFNNKKAPLDDVRVRRAIQSAIDVKAIAASVYEGFARPAIGPFPPASLWAPQQAQAVSQSVERAQALLAEAGIRPGQLKLELMAYTERPEMKDLAAVIQDQLKKIGIEIAIRQANYAALEPDMLAGKFDMTLLSRSHLTDVADPVGFLTSDYTCTGGYNISHHCNPEIDALIKQAGTLEKVDERFAAYRQIAARLQSEAVDVFIVHEQQNDAISTRLKGYRLHPLGHYVLVPELALSPQ